VTVPAGPVTEHSLAPATTGFLDAYAALWHRLRAVETVNGCTVIASQDSIETIYFGPAEMAGAYVAIVGVFPPGEPAPPLHLHPHTDEAFYVAEGDATFLLGDREVAVATGCLVFVPRGTAHTVWNSGDGSVRGLILISPGEAEHLFVPVAPASPKAGA
jgi:mannose-6-phosphate isomerase-like protein (cupin superfamily)